MFDVCVVGGGMVGSAAALGLARQGLNVALVERQLPASFAPQQPPDLRVSAVSAASQRVLESLDAWRHIAQTRMCPFTRLAVWERPECRTEFDAADLHATHLGHIVENRLVQLGLHKAIAVQSPSLEWFTGQGVVSCQLGEQGQVTLDDGTVLSAKMIVAADGAASQLRQLAGIGTQGWQYQQHAMVINVKMANPHGNITWQQFHASGPTAYLPLYGNHASLVWYHHPDKLQALKALPTNTLKAEIQAHFPDMLGDFEVLDRASFPLTRMHANRYVKSNLVLLGDAAHTINPLAGQGVNLGFKDVQALLDSIGQAQTQSKPWHAPSVLQNYERARRRDNLMMMSAMDLFYHTFSNHNPVLEGVRNLALRMADKTGPLKVQVMKYAMGVA